MEDSISSVERAPRAPALLSLARDRIQCSLPVAGTPVLVEELLGATVSDADAWLRRQVWTTVVWIS